MKIKRFRIIGIALTLALVFAIVFSGVALAWDLEDPCVAANEDFIAGGGWDNSTGEFQSGTQPWPYPKNPNNGYNLYRDDVTDSGNLDAAFILTYTPNEIDLPVITEYWHPDTGTYWYVGDESPNTWYWARSPRGYNLPRKNRIKIELPDAWSYFSLCGKATSEINYSDGTWLIHIPKGTWVLRPNGDKGFRIAVNAAGIIVSDVEFHYTCGGEVTVTRL